MRISNLILCTLAAFVARELPQGANAVVPPADTNDDSPDDVSPDEGLNKVDITKTHVSMAIPEMGVSPIQMSTEHGGLANGDSAQITESDRVQAAGDRLQARADLSAEMGVELGTTRFPDSPSRSSLDETALGQEPSIAPVADHPAAELSTQTRLDDELERLLANSDPTLNRMDVQESGIAVIASEQTAPDSGHIDSDANRVWDGEDDIEEGGIDLNIDTVNSAVWDDDSAMTPARPWDRDLVGDQNVQPVTPPDVKPVVSNGADDDELGGDRLAIFPVVNDGETAPSTEPVAWASPQQSPSLLPPQPWHISYTPAVSVVEETDATASPLLLAQLPISPPILQPVPVEQDELEVLIDDVEDSPQAPRRGYRSSPALTIANPSGFGADDFTGFVGFGYQSRTRFSDKDDGGMVFGVGFGDARENVGFQLSYTVSSFGGSRDFGTGGFNAKLHRQFDNRWAVALGWEGFATTGFTDFEDTIYGSVTHLIRTRERINQPFSRVALTAGAGTGRFRSEDAVFDDRSEVGVFGSLAMRVVEPVSAIVEWTGQDLAAGLSITPFRNLPIVFLPAVRDITGAGDGARFVFGTGIAFKF